MCTHCKLEFPPPMTALVILNLYILYIQSTDKKAAAQYKDIIELSLRDVCFYEKLIVRY